MKNKTTVFVKDAEFLVGMGYYEDEKKLKNKFVISLEVSYNPSQFKIGNINTTVDYKELMEIIDQKVHAPVSLLEDVADLVLEDIYIKYPFVIDAEIKILKTSILIRNNNNKGVGIKVYRKY